MGEINVNSELIKEIIVLARKRKENHTYSEGASLGSESQQTNEYSIAKENLKSFLNNLTYDEIKVINAVMYLGRETSEDEIKKNTGKVIFESVYKELNWDTKEIEIKRMIGKLPLDQYLQKGLDIILK